MLVRDCMTPKPVTVGPKTTLQEALEVMAARKIRHLPVIDQAGRLVGFITDRDLRRAAPSPLQAQSDQQAQAVLEETPVERVMMRAPVTVPSTSPLRAAVELMVTRKFGALPVVDGGRLVGIVSQIDVLKLWLKSTP